MDKLDSSAEHNEYFEFYSQPWERLETTMATLGYYLLITSTLALSIYTVQVCEGEYLFDVGSLGLIAIIFFSNDNFMRRTDTSYQFIGRMYVASNLDSTRLRRYL